MDPAKLKVVELRAELSHRGLETKGNKAVLVERLRKALEEENGDAVEETTILDTSAEEGGDTSITESHEQSPEPQKPTTPSKTPGRSARSSSVSSSPSKTPSRGTAKAAAGVDTPTKESPSPVKPAITDEQRTPSPIPEVTAPEEVSQEPEAPQKALTAEDLTDLSAKSPENKIHDETEEPKPEEEIQQVVPEIVEESAKEEEEEEEKDEDEPVAIQVEQKSEDTEILSEEKEEDDLTTPNAEDKPQEEEEDVKEEEKVAEVTESKDEPVPEIEEIEPKEEPEEAIDPGVKNEESFDPPKEKEEEREQEKEKEEESVEADESTNGVDELKAEKMEEGENNGEEIEGKDLEEDVQMKEESEKEDEKQSSRISNSEPTVPGEEGPDEEIQTDLKVEKIEYYDYDERAAKREEPDVEMKETKTEEDSDSARDRDRKDRRDRKRKRSASPQHERYRSPPPAKPDEEPEIDDGSVLLSWYDSDLNLLINKDNFCTATPMHNDGFGYIWAGTRASFGFRTGKLYYETKVVENCNINLQDEDNPHVLRVGWSVAGTSTQLGEEKFSYGYGGTGKISTNCKFQDYGKKFGKDDVVGCYADLTGETNIDLSFTVNGEDQGVAFSISKEEIGDVALYPHVLTKNCTFKCNFGQEETWSSDILPGYISVGDVDPQERIPGPRRPEKKEDCEMLLMCGLPAAGKTQWALQYAALHPEKMYNILGTNTLIEKMKVMGLPRKRNYHGRWELLIDKCTRALNKLLEMASTRRRNYILDQTNVYPTAQRRKMRHFYGFQRKAVVVVPTDEEFKLRTAKREAIEGKDVPDSAVLEMKANFTAPTIGESFEAVEYVELNEEDAKKLIEKYNKEGKEAGYPQQQINKRPRFEKADSYRDSRDSRSSRDSRESSRDHRDRRGYPDRNRNMGGWRGGNNGGGWRDRSQRGGGGSSSGGSGSGGNSGGGGHPRHGGSSGSSGYGASSSGGGWRGGRGGGSAVSSHRGGNDRRGGGGGGSSSGGDRRPSGNDRNRGSQSRQGGWGAMGYQGSQQQQGSGGWGQQSGWTGGQSQQTGWGQQGGWGQQQWGGWKGFGQGSYGQANYSQQNYGNGNWGGWNQQQQYYNQYWGQQQQQQSNSSGQSAVASSGQSVTTAGNTNTTNVSTTNTTAYGYPQGWQGYAQTYAFPAQTTSTNSQQAQQQK